MLKYKINILEALKEKGYTSYKIRRGDIASKETLNTICRLLDCQPGDILEYINSDQE